MKRYILIMMLAAMFLPTGLFGQENEQEEMEFRMEMRERQMALHEREAQMQELELEKRRIELEHLRRQREHREHDEDDDNDDLHPLLLLVLVVNILVAIWVYQDIRRLGRGSGIWIVIALLTGLLGTLVYAIVRIGDSEKKTA